MAVPQERGQGTWHPQEAGGRQLGPGEPEPSSTVQGSSAHRHRRASTPTGKAGVCGFCHTRGGEAQAGCATGPPGSPQSRRASSSRPGASGEPGFCPRRVGGGGSAGGASTEANLGRHFLHSPVQSRDDVQTSNKTSSSTWLREVSVLNPLQSVHFKEHTSSKFNREWTWLYM